MSTPGSYTEERSGGPPPITGAATSVTAFIGHTAAGPPDRAERVASFSDYEQVYGGLDPRRLIGYAVKSYFDNGGREAYIARLPESASAAAGMPLLARVDSFNLLCAPGESDFTVVAGLQAFCRMRRAFMIVDSPANAGVSFMQSPGVLDPIKGADALSSALYFPWVEAYDPVNPGRLVRLPPCGFVAGIFARTDAARGVWKAAAGKEASLIGAARTAIAITNEHNGALNRQAVNCIRTLPGLGTVLWGSRTLHGADDEASEWKYVPVRRLALFIEESVYRGTEWTVHESNAEPLWAQVRSSVGAFLHGLFKNGAFPGNTPQDAFFVRCDASTMTQADIDAGHLNIVVGFAPLKPAEFVVIGIRRLIDRAT